MAKNVEVKNNLTINIINVHIILFISHFYPIKPMEPREGESMFHEKIVFHFYDSIVVTISIDNNFLENRGVDVPSAVLKTFEFPKFTCFYHFEPFGNIYLDWLISPEIAISFDFFFGKRIIHEVCSCIVEIEWIDMWWKKLPECRIILHS